MTIEEMKEAKAQAEAEIAAAVARFEEASGLRVGSINYSVISAERIDGSLWAITRQAKLEVTV